MGFKFGFCTNDEMLVEGVFIITSYGERFVKDNSEEKIYELQRIISDDLFPCYQRILEIEMGLLYIASNPENQCSSLIRSKEL
jgi:hypothetical protein